MLAGLFLHATMVQNANLVLFDLIARISANFRMGAFFAVAGLLSLYAIRKHGADPWLARRVFQIGFPTLFGLFVLAPFMSLCLSWHWYRSVVPPLPALGWWHFWFLVDLLLYAPITWWLYRTDRRTGLFASIDSWVEANRPSVTLTILGVGLVTTMLLQLNVALATLAGPCQHAVWTLHQILSFAPLYLFGLVLAGSPALLRRVTARTGPPLNVLGLVFTLCLASRLLPGGSDGLFATPMSPLNVITPSLCAPAVTVLILRSALKIRTTPPLFRRVADASFTIYMLHFPIILVIDILIDPLHLSPYLAYAITVGLAGWLSYLAHQLIVRRSPVAALLLNGTSPGKARPVAAE